MKLNYMQDVLVLPASVLEASDADGVKLRVLLWLSSDLSLAEKPMQLAKLADCKFHEARAAVQYWSGKGILSGQVETSVSDSDAAGKASVSAEEQEKKPLLRRAEELPQYTTPELERILNERNTLRHLIDEAQNMIGKIFNTYECNILVAMVDYLGMSEESVLLLLAHCKRIKKTSMSAIEKYAYKLADREILSPAALEEEFRMVEALRGFEGQVRKLFGMKERALTKKEEKLMRDWLSYGYDIEIVRHAYELTISAIHEPSLPYAGSIMDRWHGEGLQTLSDIERAEVEKAAEKSGNPVLGSSFDTDEFFRIALQRSYGDLHDTPNEE